jgi:hypothetical protein
MLNDEEIRQNLFDVKNAIAQQRLEGLTPSREVVSDLERAAHGEISVRKVIANIGKRHSDAETHGQRPLPR